MSTLHLISRALDPQTLGELARSLNTNDALLLCCDAVYLPLSHGLPAGPAIFALASDIAARGLEGRLPDTVSIIDHARFVELALAHARSTSWN